MFADNRWVALDSRAVNDLALRVDNADGGLLHRVSSGSRLHAGPGRAQLAVPNGPNRLN